MNKIFSLLYLVLICLYIPMAATGYFQLGKFTEHERDIK